tara:strand:- start:1573 stop:2301 length:729 start_codon:yes stop_codon:yes gene_type:complete
MMGKSNNHSELLKAAKKAVNSFVFAPSLEKQEIVFDALASLNNFVESFDVPKEQPKPKASKSKKKPKASKVKPKASKSKSKSSRKAEIEAVLTSGKKLKRAERSALNKELHRLLSEERAAARSSKKNKKTVRRPKRTSADGLELAQAKTATANRVGKVKKTKVVHAITEGDAQPFEPRKEVPVVEPKVRKKEQMKLTLLPGESVDEAMARHRSSVLERERLEAESLIANSNPMMEPSFAPAV